MSLTPPQVQKILESIGGRCGLPAKFNGDRLAAFNYGLAEAVRQLVPMVTLDPLPTTTTPVDPPLETPEEPPKE